MTKLEPTREVTAEEVRRYETDGFVKLEGILPAEWISQATSVVEHLLDTGVIGDANRRVAVSAAIEAGQSLLLEGGVEPTGRFGSSVDQWRNCHDLGDLCTSGPLPVIAGSLFNSAKVNFLIDQIFVKEPGASGRTAFHSDESYFNCTGDQCVTFWIALDVVDAANGSMGYVPGSHLWGRTFWRNNFVSQLAEPADDGEQIPDIEGNEDAYGVQYVDVRPGDIIAHQYRTLHGSRGNTDPTRRRRALALRYGGDDLRYHERFPKAMTSASLAEGDPMDSPEFPVVLQR